MASVNVGELNYSIELDARKLAQGFNTAIRNSETAGNKAGSAFDNHYTKTASKGFTSLEKNAKQSAHKMSNALKVGILAGAAAVTAGLYQMGRVGAQQIKQSIDQASKWEQAVGALDSVYGKNADGLRKWSNEQWKIGLSANEAASQVTLFGANLKASGFSAGEAAGRAKELTSISADLAAMFGGTTQEAGTAIGATLRGEFDSIERYGVAITADLVKAQAISEGIVKSQVDPVLVQSKQAALIVAQERLNKLVKEGKFTEGELADAKAKVKTAEQGLQKALAGSNVELDQRQKKLATLSLLDKQTRDAQGQAKREAGTYEMQVMRLKAQWANLQKVAGKAFLPMVVDGLKKLNKMMPDLERKVKAAVPKIREAFKNFGDWWEKNWPQIKEGLQTFVDVLAIFRPIVQDILKAFLGLPEPVRNAVAAMVVAGGLYSKFGSPFGKLAGVLTGLPSLFGGVGGAAETAGKQAKGAKGAWAGLARNIALAGGAAIAYGGLKASQEMADGTQAQWVTDLGLDPDSFWGTAAESGMWAGNLLDQITPGNFFTGAYRDNSAAKRRLEEQNAITRQIFDGKSKKFKKNHYLYTDVSSGQVGGVTIRKKPQQQGTVATIIQNQTVYANDPVSWEKTNTRRNGRKNLRGAGR